MNIEKDDYNVKQLWRLGRLGAYTFCDKPPLSILDLAPILRVEA